MLHWLFERYARLCIYCGYYLTGLLGKVFERNAGRGSKGCWIECFSQCWIDCLKGTKQIRVLYSNGRWVHWQNCWIQSLTEVQDWEFEEHTGFSVGQRCWIGCFKGMLDWGMTVILNQVFDRDCRLLDWSSDRDAGWGPGWRLCQKCQSASDTGFIISQGCCIECLTGLLDQVQDRYAWLSAAHGCWFECLQEMLD